jgi:hypothetical protein
MPTFNASRARLQFRPLLQDDNTFGSILLIGLCDLMEPEWLDWEPKTVQLELRDSFGVLIDPDQFDKLMAARTVLTTDLPLTSLPSFIRIINALNGEGVDTPAGQPIDPEDLCWGVFEQQLIWPFDDEDKLSPEIIGYIEMSMKHFGVLSYPRILAKILPPAVYDENIVNDPDSMALQSERTTQIQESVSLRLERWYEQFDKLHLSSGNKQRLLRERPEKIDPNPDGAFSITN